MESRVDIYCTNYFVLRINNNNVNNHDQILIFLFISQIFTYTMWDIYIHAHIFIYIQYNTLSLY